MLLLASPLPVFLAMGGCGLSGTPASTATPESIPEPIGHYAGTPEASPVPIEIIPVPAYPGARLISEDRNDQVSLLRVYLVDATMDEVLRFYARELPAHGWYHCPNNPQAAPGSQRPNYDEYDLFYDESLQYFRLTIILSTQGSETRIDVGMQVEGTE